MTHETIRVTREGAVGVLTIALPRAVQRQGPGHRAGVPEGGPPAKAMELALLNPRLSPREARDAGLVTAVFGEAAQ